MPKVESNVINVFSPHDVAALLAACEREPVKWVAERNKAMLWLLLDTGIRVSELCSLTTDNVSIEQGYIRVRGKGRKQREVGLGRESRHALARFLYRFRPKSDDTHVFLSMRGGGLQRGGIWRILDRLGDAVGVDDVRCSPHTLRHTWASSALKSGMDVVRISRLLGHTSLAVTEHYLRSFDSKQARDGALSVADTFFSDKKGSRQ